MSHTDKICVRDISDNIMLPIVHKKTVSQSNQYLEHKKSTLLVIIVEYGWIKRRGTNQIVNNEI